MATENLTYIMPWKEGAGGRPQWYADHNGRFAKAEDPIPEPSATDTTTTDTGLEIYEKSGYPVGYIESLQAHGEYTEVETLSVERPLEFYNPLQPRNKDGEWAKTGSRAGELSPGITVASRQPSKGKVDLTQGHETTKWDEISDKGKQKMFERLKHAEAPGFGDAKTPEDAIKTIERNILEVHDQVAPEDAAAWKQWYVGAHHIAQDLSAQYPSVSQDAAAAIIARLSPQKDWDQNVAQAHSMIEALHQDWKITPDIAGRVAVLKAEAQGRSGKGKSGRESKLNLDPHEHMGLVGKRLSELTPEQAAFAIRANDPNPANKAVRVHADGGYSIDENTAGRPRTAWQSYDNIGHAVSIYRDQSPKNISKKLGEQHKVRSFFNNINDPHSLRHDVTADTHHFGVGLGIPVGTKHPLINSGKRNITGTGGNVADGISGTYALFAEATRRAAAKRGIEPREMQSIVWEQWRRAYPAQSRARGAVAMTEKAAQQYDADIAAGVKPAAAVKQLEAARAAVREFASKYSGDDGAVDE